VTIDAEALYVQLGRLVETMPDLIHGARPLPADVHQWLGRAYALVAAAGDLTDAISFKGSIPNLNSAIGKFDAAQNIASILYRGLAVAELRAPAAARGAFIPAGNSFDAFAAFAKLLGTARTDLLLIDPYMDEKALTDFAPLAPELVSIRLLADQAHHKNTLRPAAARWSAQYGSNRPLAVRLAPARTLHDRLVIVDGDSAWVMTQSMSAFAARSPASIVRVDGDTAALKIPAYETIWSMASPL
jgi:hypothetical protein